MITPSYIESTIPVTLNEKSVKQTILRRYERYTDLEKGQYEFNRILIESHILEAWRHLDRKMDWIFSENIEGLVYWSDDDKLNHNLTPIKFEVEREFFDLIRFN